MKAERIDQKPPFVPVLLTLESQAEVDAIFTVMNHTHLSEALNFEYGVHEVLRPYRDVFKALQLHEAVVRLCK